MFKNGDGVSGSQLKQVLTHELNQIIKVTAQLFHCSVW